MEPQIRYVKTSDDVSIAYWAIGHGTPLVLMDLPVSNIQHEWSLSGTRAGYEQIASALTLVRYDHRGFGLSDAPDEALTTDALVSDLEAVVDRLELPQFLLVASRGPTYPIALAYAKRHPERVLRIAAVLGGPPEGFTSAIIEMPDVDWQWLTDAVARRIAGPDDDSVALELADQLRHSTNEAGMRRFVRWFETASDPGDLSDVHAPCLWLPMDAAGRSAVQEARKFASSMPDAIIQTISDPTSDQRAETARMAITRFFAQDLQVRPAGPTVHGPSAGMTAILFADIAESTALTEQLGDTAFREKARTLDDALRTTIREKGGQVIEGKLLGDGILATFSGESQAIAAALNLEAAAAPTGLGLHVGLHAGDVIRESNNVFGGAVNIAARISALAPPGEVFVSRTVADLARTSAGVTFEDRGDHALKGIAEPQRVFAVRAS